MQLRLVFLMFILFIVVYPQKDSPVVKQTQQVNTQVRPFTDITYEITTPTQTVLPLQPIPIILRQKNMTNDQVLGYRSIGFTNMPIYLHIRKSGSNKTTVLGDFSQIFEFIAYTNVEIPPNSVSEAKEWIWLGLGKYFAEPGTYEVKAVVPNDKRTQSVESNTITIEIQEPTGTNREVYNLIKNSGFQESFFSHDSFNKTKNMLETITVRFPNSPYAKGASFVLGEEYFKSKQYLRALNHLTRLENDNDFIFADKVRNYLAEIRRLPLNEQQENVKNQ